MTKRLSLILSDADQARLDPFVRAGSGEYRAVQRWAKAHGGTVVGSEAAALRVLLQAGVEALTDDVLDEGYAQLAESYHGDEERDERRAARNRYTERTEGSV